PGMPVSRQGPLVRTSAASVSRERGPRTMEPEQLLSATIPVKSTSARSCGAGAAGAGAAWAALAVASVPAPRAAAEAAARAAAARRRRVMGILSEWAGWEHAGR